MSDALEHMPASHLLGMIEIERCMPEHSAAGGQEVRRRLSAIRRRHPTTLHARPWLQHAVQGKRLVDACAKEVGGEKVEVAPEEPLLTHTSGRESTVRVSTQHHPWV